VAYVTDGVRNYKEAPPSPGAAHSVTEAVTFLQQMIEGDNDSDYSEAAFGVNMDSDSSKETVEPEKCMWNKKYKGYRFKSICNGWRWGSNHATLSRPS
jgi:hypothetical protein